jgi:FAD:protein FMN transferase
MACRFEVLLSGEDRRHVAAARDALDEAGRLETALTVHRDTSELIRVNHEAGAGPVAVTPELFALLSRCVALSAATGGAFDVTTTPLSRCWGFFRRAGRLPAPDALAAARACVGMDGLRLEAGARTVTFTRPGVEINLGSIGKGFAVEAIAARLRSAGVRHALVSAAGSSTRAIGGRDGGWAIDLRSRRATGPLARLRLRNGALGTSGAGEQGFDHEGRRYGHVLDPRTGWPAAGIVSASVVTRDAADADALATAMLIGGVPLAQAYCGAHPHTLVLLTPEGTDVPPVVIGGFDGVQIEIVRDERPGRWPAVAAETLSGL